LETEQVGPDVSGEPASARVNHAMSEDSLDCWSLILDESESLENISKLSEERDALAEIVIPSYEEYISVMNVDVDVELTLNDLQTCHATINDLKQKTEEEQKKLELALKDAHTKEEVIGQMRLTITEQEKSISEKAAEIEHLKAADGLRTGCGKREKHPSSEGVDQKMVETLQKVEQLSCATSVNDQAIVDMREQNLQQQRQSCQLQQQMNVSEAEVAPRKNAPRRSRIPRSQRAPLRAIDGNAGVLADGGVAVDLDKTVGASRRNTRKHHVAHQQTHSKQLLPKSRSLRSRHH